MRHFIVVLALTVGSWGTVHADEAADNKARAKVHFANGDRLFRAKNYNGALNEFQDGYALFPGPGFLFNIAESYRGLNQAEKAAENYEAFIKARPNDPLAKQARDELTKLRPALDRLAAVRKEAADQVRLEAEEVAKVREQARLADAAERAAAQKIIDEARDKTAEAQRIEPPAPIAAPAAVVTSESNSPSVPPTPEKRKHTAAIAIGVVVGLLVVGAAVGVGVALLIPQNASVPSSNIGAPAITVKF